MTAYALTAPQAHAPYALRRPLLIGIAVGLCVAAVAAIVAILSTGTADDLEDIIATGLGLALFSATSAAGAMLLRRGWESVHALGWVTIALSAVSFCASLVATFTDDYSQVFGCAALATLACAQASIVLVDSSDDDSVGVLSLCWTSIVLAVSFAGLGIALITEAIAFGEDAARALGVLLILNLLTFAFTPILRRVIGTK